LGTLRKLFTQLQLLKNSIKSLSTSLNSWIF
jgi:hypothetical protein